MSSSIASISSKAILLFMIMHVKAESQSRNPRLFLVTTSSTTSTLMTNNICYVTAATPVTCTRKKRRAVISDILETPRAELDISPDTLERHADAIDSSANSKLDKVESSEREARLLSGLLYWITTTTTSTTTSYLQRSLLAVSSVQLLEQLY